VPLIRGLFFAPGAEAILKIPLRQGGGEDWLAWLKENSGSYSVGSAYRALILTGQRQLQAQDEISELSAVQSGDLWKKLWKLGWYLKCMYFGGGFLWNPSRLRDLSRRHVMVNITYGIWKTKSETLMHALIGCSHASVFWEAAKTPLLVKLRRLHPDTWAVDILREQFFTERERSTMYQIWTSIFF
jgi:hypothetical protein